MSKEKKTGRKLTQARKEANARYNSKFVEVKAELLFKNMHLLWKKVPPLSSTVQLMRLWPVTKKKNQVLKTKKLVHPTIWGKPTSLISWKN